MRMWRPQLHCNPGRTHSFFSMTGLGSWSYEIKADVWQSTARGKQVSALPYFIRFPTSDMKTGSDKSFVSDDSWEARGQSIAWRGTCVPSILFLDEI